MNSFLLLFVSRLEHLDEILNRIHNLAEKEYTQLKKGSVGQAQDKENALNAL